MERKLRGIAGTLIIVSVYLFWFVHPYWVLFTLFIGLNLLQSAFTNWCPMMWIFKKCGCKDEGSGSCCGKS